MKLPLILMFILAACTPSAEVDIAETSPGEAKVADCSALACDAGIVLYTNGCSCACDGDGGIGVWADLPLTPQILNEWKSCAVAICGGSICQETSP